MSVATKQPQLAIRGGAPAARRDWPSWPVWDDAERRGLLDVLESGKWWFGERVHAFERAFAQFHHLRHGISCTNGTTAIEVGLSALGVTRGCLGGYRRAVTLMTRHSLYRFQREPGLLVK